MIYPFTRGYQPLDPLPRKVGRVHYEAFPNYTVSLVKDSAQEKLLQVPNNIDASLCNFCISITNIAIKLILALREIY